MKKNCNTIPRTSTQNGNLQDLKVFSLADPAVFVSLCLSTNTARTLWLLFFWNRGEGRTSILKYTPILGNTRQYSLVTGTRLTETSKSVRGHHFPVEGFIKEGTTCRNMDCENSSRLGHNVKNYGWWWIDSRFLYISKDSLPYYSLKWLFYINNEILSCLLIINRRW